MHSFDILFLELVYAAFWFNPIFVFYKKALKQSHEYLADAIVTNQYDKNNYKQILLNHTVSGLQMELTNQFFNSQIKKRLEMINSKSSHKTSLSRYLFLLPLVLLLGVVFASNTDMLDSSNTEINTDIPLSDTIPALQLENEIEVNSTQEALSEEVEGFKIVDRMPLFPGCNELESNKESLECSQQNLIKHLYSNVKYPKEARNQGIEGTAIVQFVISSTGNIDNVKILKNPGGGLGEAAKKVVEEMVGQAGKWTPGMLKGKNVSVIHTLPVKFLLQNGNNDKNILKKQIEPEIVGDNELERITVVGFGTPKNDDDENLYKIVDQMPIFPGCENISSYEKRRTCGFQAMLKHIYENVTYPLEAKSNGVEGTAVIQFVVKSDGDIKNVNILRDPGAGLGAEAKKVVEEMVSKKGFWSPGRLNGKAINLLYTLPVKFKLAGDDKKSENPDPLFILDGKKASREEIGMKAKGEFKSEGGLTYLDGKTATDKYGEEGENGVFEITSKESKEKDLIKKSKNMASIKLKSKDGKSPLFVVDGNIESEEFMQQYDPQNIKSMNVLKGEKAIEEYGDKGKNGAVVITSKKNIKSSKDLGLDQSSISVQNKNELSIEPLYIVNGEKTSKSKIANINPDDIASINVLKGEGAIEEYGDEGKNGVVVITMKNVKKDKGSKNVTSYPTNDVNNAIAEKDREIQEKELNNALHIFDGIKMSYQEAQEKNLQTFNSSNSANFSVNVMTLEKSEAIEKYGKEGKNGVVIWTTNTVGRSNSTISFSVSPNPATDLVKLQVTLKSNEPVSINTYNMNGSLIKQENIQSPRLNFEHSMDIKDATGQILLIVVSQGESSMTQKVMINR